MKKFYKEPEAELLVLEATIETLISSPEADKDLNDHDGNDINDLINP